MNRRLMWLFVVLALAIVSPGCGDSGTNLEPKKPSAAGVGGTKAETPAAKAAVEKAKKADPRGR